MTIVLLLAATLLAAFAALPLMKFERWWIRVFDFPRVQIAALAAVVVVGLLLSDLSGGWLYAGLGLAGFALIAELAMILPYTAVWPKEAVDAIGGQPTLRLMIANVKMSNRQADGLLKFIEREQPDVIVFDEPDDWWEQQLRTLEQHYPHTLKDPRSNTYGMLLYSRIEFVRARQREILDPEIPSFHVCIRVDGREVGLHLIHPAPPYPKFAKTTLGRDAELLVVGRLASQEKGPLIVAGDLNDVAWSHTTRLFQRVSRLLDPRRGRGMFNTFHAKYWWARWPLDHLFHSPHFRLVRIERGPAYGSDHFPILIELELDRDARDEHSPPDLEEEHSAEASEKISDAAEKLDTGK